MDIRNAIQYFGMDARMVECPFARRLLDQLPMSELRGPIIVDSKLSMLKPKWYPCIGGWHYDEILRKPNGLLDWENNRLDKQHFLMVIDEGTHSLTEIAYLNPLPNKQKYESFPLVADYSKLNEWMKLNRDKYWTEFVKSGHVYKLTNTTPHRGSPATGSGWRYFVRATINTQRNFVNEIRTQTQVYIHSVDKGW